MEGQPSSFSAEEQELLAKFVSDPTRDVFAVFPSALPGMIGSAYARYSRAKGGFLKTLLKEFIEEGKVDAKHADELIQRILIQYGDDSVQELESAWLSLENVSNIATKVIEDRRLGAYIEQSSRYVFYDEKNAAGQYRYLREPSIMQSAHAQMFLDTMDFVFATYCRLIEPMQEYFRQRKPLETAEYQIRDDRGKMHYAECSDDRERKDFERTWKFDLRAKTCDTLRILLPVATQTNVGMHANGRTFEHMLRHLYSSDLLELQQIAKQAQEALNTVIRRYVQRAQRSEYLVATRQAMEKLAQELLGSVPVQDSPRVDVITEGFTDDGQLAAMLYPFAQHSYRQLRELVSRLSPDQRRIIRSTYIGERKTRRDRPGRALEFGYPWLVDLKIDLGIYRDLHRHRMMTQQRQDFTVELGFSDIPDEINEAGYAADIQACVDKVTELYHAIKKDLGSAIAQYVVLFGFNTRCMFGFNDREAQHLLELRTQPQGHRSYRLVCQEIARKMRDAAPERVESLLQFVDDGDYDWPRADSEAKQRLKEARLDGKKQE